VSPADFLPTIDLLVVPSNWGEAFGLVAAEALSARVPVIVSDDGALPEVVGTEHSYIVRAGDVDDLARALVRFTDERMHGIVAPHVDASRLRWEEQFSPQAGRTRLEALLTRIEVPA
jgi:glycosyltransferase involved in cell wall biosynthesis